MRVFHLVEAESLWALSQRGSVNLPQVKELQNRLRAAGHDPGPSDGWYGRRTANAVRAYQQANNLTVDGDAGPQTLGSLGMAGANNTPPRETPPEETPPPPAPRRPESEPPDEPAPTAREPEPEPAPTARKPEPEPAPTAREPEPEPAPTAREPEQEREPEDEREPEQEREPEDEVADTPLPELVRRISSLDAPATAMYIGRFNDETGATYYFGKVKMSQNNPNVVIYLGGRRSAAPDELLQRQGRPRDSFSIYAFSLTENVGYNITGRTDHDTLEDALTAFDSAEISPRSYPLDRGSTQYMRRAHIMRVLRTNPIPAQNESVLRLSKLAGL